MAKRMTIDDRIMEALRNTGIIVNSQNKNVAGQDVLYVRGDAPTLDKIMREGKPVDIFVCPHPDDPEIGVGAYITKYANRRAFVFVYMTNGVGSLIREEESEDIAKQIFGRLLRKNNEEDDKLIIKQRKKQAEKSMEFLGVAAGIFTGYGGIKKGNYEEREKIIASVAEIIVLLQPKRIFVPQPYDQHLTHLLTTYVCVCAANEADYKKGKILGYAVWGPIPYGVATRSEFVRKEHINRMKQALKLHETEAVKDYGKSAECMMLSDAIVSKNEPDSPKNMYLLRTIRLDNLKGMNRMGVITTIAQCVQNPELRNQFYSQFEVR